MNFDQITKEHFREGDKDEKEHPCDLCLSYGVMESEDSHYITKEHYSEAFGSLFNPPIKVHLCKWCYQEQR
tara:strand:+ start:267 stop:479 length:213 start_codon:yes stop_codon:yes gene_type:complete